MFSYVRNFVCRHRRKFIFTGVALGGLSLLTKYAEKRLLEWGENSANKILQQQKRKTHYERSLQTTRVMMLELLPNIRKIIENKLDSERIVLAIKEQPEIKRKLWEDLKRVGFGRVVAGIVSAGFISPVAHVMMMVMAAYTLDEGSTDSIATQMVQAQYMASLQRLVEEQLPSLIDRIVTIVNDNVSTLLLTEKLTVSQLEGLLQKIILEISSDRSAVMSDLLSSESSMSSTQCSPPQNVLPWSQYLVPPESISDHPLDQKTLRDMSMVTADICNTDDFCDVINILSQLGINFVLDEVSENPVYALQPLVKIQDTDAEVSPAKPVQNSDLNTASCAVAKIVPVLSALLGRVLSDANQANSATSFYGRLVNCTQLEALSYNVYNALMFGNNHVSQN